MNILLIAGGWSSEREVSLAGSNVVHDALIRLGHNVTRHDPAFSLAGLAEAVAGKDFAFINLHGSPGEDGLIQAMLERLACPYQGAGPAASMLALNKAAAKVFFTAAGLPTPEGLLLNRLPATDWQPSLRYPLFIKATTGGSSLHMEQVSEQGQLYPALERLFASGPSYLVESAVDGEEISCGVLGNLRGNDEIAEALPPVLIRPSTGKVFDYASKYAPGGAEEICPPPLSPELTERIRNMALTAHRVLGISGYSRSDFILRNAQEPVLLEINTLPGMTPTSLLPQEAAAAGISFEQLVCRLIDLGMARHRR
ncbi:MAG: D-alanine--D-alanine ligase [Desulfovibrio sp.]|jgi:D-alanine-D-alanine ligase|nr:D-alanine--D-alanine ligase [Desulfovibrio sp.]